MSDSLADSHFTTPGDMAIDSDSVYALHGNFFLVDRWLNTTSYIKYINLSPSGVDIFGATIEPNYVSKLLTTDGYVGAVATFLDQICYSQGANTPHFDEEEGVLASSATLSSPWGLAFDKDGNLYISNYSAQNIRMVKRWF